MKNANKRDDLILRYMLKCISIITILRFIVTIQTFIPEFLAYEICMIQ